MREHPQHRPQPWPPKAAPPAGLPDVDTLIAFRDGALDAEDEDRMRVLLASSPAAMDELLDLEGFETLAHEDRERFAAPDVEAAWQRFESALDAPAVSTVVPMRRRPAERAGWLALAAALLAVVGLSVLGPRDAGVSGERTSGPQALFVDDFESGTAALVIERPAPPRPADDAELLLETDFEGGEVRGWTVVSSRS